MNGDRTMTGLGLRLLAVMMLTFMGALIKLAEGRGAKLPELMLFRQLFAIPVVVSWVALGSGLATLRTQRLGAHATRAALGLTGMAFTFGALLLLPLAEATAISFTVPIFATILSALVLKEPTGWHRWAAVAIGFAGVLIVTQPGSGHIPVFGALVGLTSALMISIIAIQLRQLGRTENAGTTVFWFSVLSCIPLGIAYPLFAVTHDAATWALLIGIGVVGGMGQIAFTAALRFAPVSVVMPMDYSGLIWATLFGWLLFGALPDGWTFIGAPVIVASGLYIFWRERRLGLRASPVIAADEETDAARRRPASGDRST
ncbi:DMT family transporter [Sphingomonas turrisvirgatae]|uniref:Permease n=1 Tax=Sphingomonas turrisvirgatae TaxID=1888892 RepID=A0A1E3LT09_9SPHN|nr:DMT family transporter [Sphingomonas turrisvirgatae]ODP36859.1 permease [Sphingomonas turrisvirgatae]